MGGSVVQSFSYGLKEVPIVAEAVDKAKQRGLSFSEYIVDLIKDDIKKNRKKN